MDYIFVFDYTLLDVMSGIILVSEVIKIEKIKKCRGSFIEPKNISRGKK